MAERKNHTIVEAVCAMLQDQRLPKFLWTEVANTAADEIVSDVEEPMDPIDPPPHEPSSSRKRPSWLGGTLDDAEGHAAP